jgi:uncharacterized protein YhaN
LGFCSLKAPVLPIKGELETEKLSSEIELNKEKIREEEAKLNAPRKEEKKSLSDLLEYFKRIGK